MQGGEVGSADILARRGRKCTLAAATPPFSPISCSMDWYRDRTVLLTGASGSIGSAMARLLAPQRTTLILTGRAVERLKAVAEACRAEGSTVETVVHDLGRVGAAAELYEQVKAAGHEVDILINNAGFGKGGWFTSFEAADYEEMITVNATNLVSLSRLFLPAMIDRGTGGVMNMSSASSFLPIPKFAVYAATKAFVNRFSAALHAEVKSSGVHVTCVAPGNTESDFFFERARMARPAGGIPGMDANRVAKRSLEALARNKRLVAVGAFDKFVAFGTRLAPTPLTLFLARKFMDRAE